MPRLLIVDDDANNRAVAADALEYDEYEIAEAVDGQDCLQQVAEQPCDLILLDVMMPGIDGLETLRRLSANEATRHIPVIMLTALDMDSQIAICLDEGAIDHVSKPFSSVVLRARVRAALRSKATADAGSKPQRGEMLALVGAKGGVGTTTLAVNLAARLTQESRTATICEAQPDAVSAAIQLGLSPRCQSEHVLGGGRVRVTRRAVERLLLSHSCGIRVLLGPAESNCDVEPSAESIAEVVSALRELAQHTILDVGNGQSPAGREFLREADQVLMVLELEPCSLAAAQIRLGQLKELGLHPGVVINNRVQIPSPPIGLQHVGKQLNCDILGVIPADPEGCMASIKLGMPICLSRPTSTTAGAITALANRLIAQQLPGGNRLVDPLMF